MKVVGKLVCDWDSQKVTHEVRYVDVQSLEYLNVRDDNDEQEEKCANDDDEMMDVNLGIMNELLDEDIDQGIGILDDGRRILSDDDVSSTVHASDNVDSVCFNRNNFLGVMEDDG